MHEIASIKVPLNGSAGLIERAATAPQERRAPAHTDEPGGDRVELSAAATDADPQTAAAPGVDPRIEDLRSRIAAGTYLTPDKIDTVVERLHAEVFGN